MTNANKWVILYVDDDDDDCVILQTSLEDADSRAQLICSHDGEEAIHYLNSTGTDALPSLIVLDLNMPRWDGRRTLNYLKSQPHLASIPVVILSTSANEKEQEDCRQMGAISYYSKPYSYEEYKGIVAGFFSMMKE